MIHTVAAATSDGPGGYGPGPALRPVQGEGGHVLAEAGRRGSGRRPGSFLVAVATGLLFLLGVGLFAVSLDAQYRYVFHAKHQSAASWIEALALDVGMAIFSLLALGLARAGKPARAERVLIMACAAASGVMNFAAANDASPKSVLAYVMPPVFLAVVADRVVSVARRHVLGVDERSPWLAAASLVAYALRLVLAPASTATGLRRWLLLKTPLPGTRAPAVVPAPQPKAIGGRRGPAGRRAGSKTARFLALVEQRHGPPSRPSGLPAPARGWHPRSAWTSAQPGPRCAGRSWPRTTGGRAREAPGLVRHPARGHPRRGRCGEVGVLA